MQAELLYLKSLSFKSYQMGPFLNLGLAAQNTLGFLLHMKFHFSLAEGVSLSFFVQNVIKVEAAVV